MGATVMPKVIVRNNKAKLFIVEGFVKNVSIIVM